MASLAGRMVRSTRASTAVQAAMVLPVLIMITAGFVDIGRANYGHGRLENAVSAGVQYAYLTGAGVTAANVQTMIQGLADSVVGGVSQVTATVSGPGCFCVTGSPGSVSLTAATCNSLCADGTQAEYYVSVTATYTFTPLFPAIATFVPTTFTSTAVIALK